MQYCRDPGEGGCCNTHILSELMSGVSEQPRIAILQRWFKVACWSVSSRLGPRGGHLLGGIIPALKDLRVQV